MTISSPGVGDGKSFVSSNLALSFANLGHRTIVVDGDIRRGTIHRLFNGERGAGLTEYLVGEIDPAAVVRRTQFPSLDYIPSGNWRTNGPELLSSPSMRTLLGKLKSQYEVIILDSPPLGAGSDSYILASLTGHLLLVLRTGQTDRAFTETKLEAFDRLPVRILGAVLNAVPATGPYQYYYYASEYQIPARTAGAEPVALKTS